MTAYIEFSVQELMDECAEQTSLDLQAMRSRGVETADAVYDDWVLAKEAYPIAKSCLDDIASDMAFALRSMVTTYDVDSESHVSFMFEVPDGVMSSPIWDKMAIKYFKQRVLAWWYQYRDAEYSAAYMAKAEGSLNKLFTLFIPRSGTSIGRYF